MSGFSNLELFILLLGVPMALGMWAQFRVKSAFGKYSRVRASSNATGAQAAREILHAAGISDVDVVQINGMLGDHYDPTHKRLCLSSDVYNSPSVAALGIAAHESGHAIQHAVSYAPLKARMAVVPVTMFASQLLPFVMIGGLLLGIVGLLKIGVIIYAILAAFQLITLPVEFDASRRAKVILQNMHLIQPGGEAAGVNRVLNAAALTYVAAFVAALGNLIYLFLLSRRE
jgi:Zn-dependent membrane protease YugP